MEKIPNFFIVGAAKSGSTALQEMLSKHPNIPLSHDSRKKYQYVYEFTNINSQNVCIQNRSYNSLDTVTCYL